MTVDQVLFGYYIIPTKPGTPLEVVINPEGNEFRSKKRYLVLCTLRLCVVFFAQSTLLHRAVVSAHHGACTLVALQHAIFKR